MLNVWHILSDLEVGGAQLAVLDLVARLDRTRFAPRVCCLRSGGALEPRLREMGVPFHLCRFASRLSPLGLWRLGRLWRADGAAIVHTHLRRANHAARLAAVLARVPVIIAHHHDTLEERKLRQRWLTGWLNRRSDRLLCVSEGVRAARLAAGDRPEAKLQVFHNCIDPDEYRDPTPSATVKAELGLPPAAPVVGMVGRLHPLKNHDLFLRAAACLAKQRPDVAFAVVGDGELRPALETQARELGLRIVFTGARLDMARVYRALDCLAVCSEREGFGKVILEAQAAGLPVAARDVDGVAEVLRGGGGRLVASTAPETWAEVWSELLRPEVRREMQVQAEGNLQRFLAPRLIGQLESLYLELYSRNTAGSGQAK